MSYNNSYIITTLSSSLSERSTGVENPVLGQNTNYAPIIPFGRLRQGDQPTKYEGTVPIAAGGIPYTVTNGTSAKFPIGNVCYNGVWKRGRVGNYSMGFDGSYSIAIGASDDGPESANWGWMNGYQGIAAFEWSICFWIRFPQAPGGFEDYCIMGTTNGAADETGFTVKYNDDDDDGTANINAYIKNGAGETIGINENNAVIPADTNWHFVAITWDIGEDGENMKISIDGGTQSAGNKTANTPSNAVASSPLRIGAANDDTLPFIGFLDEISIWSKALPMIDIQTLYNGGFGQPANGGGSSLGYMDDVALNNNIKGYLVNYFNFENGPGNAYIASWPTGKSGSETMIGGDTALTTAQAGTKCPYPIKKPWWNS